MYIGEKLKSYRWTWAITLLFYLSGCTAYSPAVFLNEKRPAPLSGGELVKVGSGVRLTLLDGKTVHGTILEITKDSLAFGKGGNYGLEKVYYPFANIVKVEVPHSTAFSRIMTTSIVTVTVLAIVLAAALANGLEGMN